MASGCEAASGHPPLFPPAPPQLPSWRADRRGGRRGDGEGQRPPAPGWSQGQHPGLCSSPSKLSLGGKTQLEKSDPGRIKCPGSGEGDAPAQPRSTLVHLPGGGEGRDNFVTRETAALAAGPSPHAWCPLPPGGRGPQGPGTSPGEQVHTLPPSWGVGPSPGCWQLLCFLGPQIGPQRDDPTPYLS